MLRKVITLLSIAPLAGVLLLLSVPVYAEAIYTPGPIAVPAGKKLDDVKNAVRKSLFKRNWQIKDIGPGHIEATYKKSGRHGAQHIAIVTVTYDSKVVRIAYKSSEDLDYDKAAQTIHKTYNRWVRNMEKDIRGSLGSY